MNLSVGTPTSLILYIDPKGRERGSMKNIEVARIQKD